MKIDIHRHADDKGRADLVMRNIFPNQIHEIEKGRLYSAGLHPWHVNVTDMDHDLDRVRMASKNPCVIAIGEAGLDKIKGADWSLQWNAFKRQVNIAIEVQKPIIIHCVRSYNEIMTERIRSGHSQPWIIHWFNGSLEQGLQLIDKGFYLSFGHMLFNEKSKVMNAFPNLPSDFLFLETDDAGYEIDEIYARAASLRRISIDVLESQIKKNFQQCFNIDL